MEYCLMPSLEYRVLAKIAVTLWNNNDARYLSSKISRLSDVREKKRDWQKVENEVIKKAHNLPMPELLKNRLSSFVTGVGWEIILWLDFHENRCNFVTGLPKQFYWTPHGAIDKKKTAEMLVQDETLDIVKRYKLACIYCLDSHIYALWDKLSGGRLCRKGLDVLKVDQQPLVSYWTHQVEEKRDAPTSCVYVFQRSAFSGNEVATRYFFAKLNEEEKEEILLRTTEFLAKRSGCFSQRTDFPREHYAGVLCFLLSAMTEDQHMELYKRCPLQVLMCLLEWPWQDVFMRVAQHMWNLLSEEHYCVLLKIIMSRITAGYKDCKYNKLLGEFWQQIPPYSKSSKVKLLFDDGASPE